jgi:DNA-binding NtrC family response regulator
MTATILIADDDPVQRRLLDAMVRRFGYTPILTESGEEAIRQMQAPEGRSIDLLVLDLMMPGLDGFGVMNWMREQGRSTPVIVQTAHGSIDTVVTAMRAGAADFVVKPVGPERLQVCIRNALKQNALEGEVRRISRKQAGTLTFGDLPTKSDTMARALHLGKRASNSGIPVMLEGETGVGKELFSRAIAASGDRSGKPFVAVNCGAIPANLVESVLFGHEKGSFTGATDKHLGKFAEADGGTLFLDEVGELPLDTQVKLLRALQEGEVDPVGGKKAVKVDIRVISATNKSLMDMVREGKFREDLYYRLGVFPIALPPLRARKDDIPDLARRFLARFAAEENRAIRSISSVALNMLMRYSWPGNVRQLENVIFRAVVLAESDELDIQQFPQIASAVGVALNDDQPASGVVVAADTPPAGQTTSLSDNGHIKSLVDIEREAIRQALLRYDGQMSEVARRLGIGRSTLYRKLKELGLDDENCGPDDTPSSEAAA